MMREFLKGVVILVILITLLVSAFSWIADRPNQLTWMLRVGSPIGALLAFLLFLRIHFRPDEAPDYLMKSFGSFFDRGGFCFVVTVSRLDDICYFNAFFQNKYERPCTGSIAIRPAKGFFGRRKLDAILFHIDCEAAAFGIVSLPVPIPFAMQGKQQKFEIGASVNYPEGKGRMLRFQDGFVIRTNSKFGNTFGTTLAAVGALGGAIALSKPHSFAAEIPEGVAEEISEELEPKMKTLWKLGDPFLEALAETPKDFN